LKSAFGNGAFFLALPAMVTTNEIVAVKFKSVLVINYVTVWSKLMSVELGLLISHMGTLQTVLWWLIVVTVL
jgi:hypothetical protein